MQIISGVWQIQILLSGALCNFFFSINIFNPWLAKSSDAEPVDTEGQLYL